jgi:hypothetical protein
MPAVCLYPFALSKSKRRQTPANASRLHLPSYGACERSSLYKMMILYSGNHFRS